MAIIWNNLLNVLKSKKGLGITFTRSAYDFAAFVDIVSSKIMEKRKIIRSFRKDHGKTKVADITVDQMYRSMTGTETLVYEPSNIDPEKGIRYYNQTISECWERLPKVDGGHQPLPEGMFHLLVTGDIPDKEQVKMLSKEWVERAVLPKHICTMLNNFPCTLHPVSQFSCAITALNNDSKLVKELHNVKRSDYWKIYLEDSMDLIAKAPSVAANIYRNIYKGGKGSLLIDPEADWAANFTTLLGLEGKESPEMMRMILTLLSDHGGGSLSTHASQLVCSALSDQYLCFAAALNGLAGPRAGKACEDGCTFLMKMRDQLGENPSEAEMRVYVYDFIKCGHRIPGYGHGILNNVDPRFLCEKEFATKNLPNDPLFKLALTLEKVAHPLLVEIGTVKCPWPNVYALLGLVLNHYGLKETNFYPVIMGVSRCLGIAASSIWSRGMILPIERPKSYSTGSLMKMLGLPK